jgi:hypothetical protein
MKHLIRRLFTVSIAVVPGLGQSGFTGPGRYEIASLKSGKVMDLDRTDQTTVMQYAPRGTDNQRWDIEPAAGGSVYIRNAMNGKALEAPQNSNSAPLICRRFDRNPSQQWRLRPATDGSLLIVSQRGRTVDVPNGSNLDGLRLQIYDMNGDSNQRFVFRRVGSPPTRPDDRDRRISDRMDLNREPDAQGRYWDDDERMWKLAGDGVCFYRQTDFRGEALCTRSANDIAEVSRDYGFGSVKLFGRAQVVEVFDRPGFHGERFRITRDTRDLDRMGSRVGSFRVN